ncbi:MAG: Na+/H+ antiporter subunit E [Bacteroidales bacterium]
MKHLVLFLVLLGFWLLFSFSLQPWNIAVGAACALVVTLLFGRYFVGNVRKFIQPLRYFWAIIYVFYFLWECIKANFDVAYRVIHPAMPIKPGIVKVKLSVKSEIARVMLANSITMTPGTITVDILDDHLFIHWINVKDADTDDYAYKICGKFEKMIGRIFE